MRNTDEQLKIILHRADELKQVQKTRWQLIGSVTVSVICLALIPAVLILLSGMSGAYGTEALLGYGSLLLKTEYIGYVMTGMLAFISGAFLIIAFQKRKEYMKRKRDGR